MRHDRGAWQPLLSGAVVAAASEIRTGPAAEVLLTRGNDRVRLKGQSYLELPAAAADGAPADGTPRDGTMTRFVQWLGEAVFEVDHRPDPHFEVDTPYLTAIVKGTAFTVDVTHDGSAVAVTQGVVAVGTPGGATTVVTAGMTAAATPASPASPSRTAAPPPPPSRPRPPTPSTRGRPPTSSPSPAASPRRNPPFPPLVGGGEGAGSARGSAPKSHPPRRRSGLAVRLPARNPAP
jgi:hypothetical protein